MLDIGKLRKRITIESFDDTPTSSGETTDIPKIFATTWASIEPLSGKEYWIAKEQQSLTTHKIVSRYVKGVTTKMRAAYQGRIFNFTSVNNVGELNQTLEILAIEVTQ